MNDQKLLFLSEKVDDLVQIIEGFISLLYPFDSRHLGLYMPVVPHNVAVQSDGVRWKLKKLKCSKLLCTILVVIIVKIIFIHS